MRQFAEQAMMRTRSFGLALAPVPPPGELSGAIYSEGDVMVPKLAEASIAIPQTNPLLLPIISVIPTQLFAYHVADHRGTDVDQPRNLAKSVTVE